MKHSQTMHRIKLVTLDSELVLKYHVIGNQREGYGIALSSKNIGTGEKEKQQIRGIFNDKQAAEILCQLLCKYQVTPVTLKDVVEDYILM